MNIPRSYHATPRRRHFDAYTYRYLFRPDVASRSAHCSVHLLHAVWSNVIGGIILTSIACFVQALLQEVSENIIVYVSL